MLKNETQHLCFLMEELANEIYELNQLLKCDATQMNASEALLELAFELKRYNDNKEKELKNKSK